MQTSLQQEEIKSITYAVAGANSNSNANANANANANVLTKEESNKQDCDFTRGGDKDKDTGQAEIVPTTDVAQRKVIDGRAKTQHLKNWVDSWGEKNHPTPFVWLHVYGYYRKEKHRGGYGVILRDWLAKPIAAAGKCSADENSVISNVLMGVNAGILLADKHGLSVPIRAICNSFEIRLVYQCWDSDCTDNYVTCGMCLTYFTNIEDCNASLVPFRRKIIDMTRKGRRIRFDGFPTVGNRAAKYIAKIEEKNRPKAENKEERSVPGDEDPREINLGDFPRGLNVILWKDAFETKFYRYEGPMVTTENGRSGKTAETKGQRVQACAE